MPLSVNVETDSCYTYLDTFGRLFFDTCKGPYYHLLAEVQEGKDRRKCRIELAEIIMSIASKHPGKKGKYKIQIEFTPDEE